MTGLELTFLFCAIFAVYAFGAYLDQRFNLRIVDWFNGESTTPMTKQMKTPPIGSSFTENTAQLTEMKELKERIQILEKIVTEPAYELAKKLNSLQ